MALRKFAALLASLVVLASAFAVVVAAQDTSDSPTTNPGKGHGRGNNTTGDDLNDTGPPRGNASGTSGSNGSDASQLARAQHEERAAFQDEMRDARDACHNLTDDAAEEACLSDVTTEIKAFNTEQRNEFQDALASLEHGPPADALGGFVLADGDFVGKFVSFHWEPGTATLSDYTVGGCLVFDAVTLTGLTEGTELSFDEHGRAIQIRGGGASLLAHDNPRGVLVGRAADDGSLDFTISSALSAALAGQGNGSRVNISGCEDWRGTLAGHDLTLDGHDASATDQAIFLAHEANPAESAAAHDDDEEVDEAIADGDVGAEINVAGEDDADTDTAVLDDTLTVDTERGEGRVRVVVSGDGSEPKTFIVNIAPGLLQGDQVVVRYFDEDAGTFTDATITAADDLADVLDPTNDAGPEYWVQHDADGAVVYVSIDHWSIHAFEVLGFAADVPPSVLAGLVGGVVLVAMATAGLTRRRRSN
ncbi:MAG TPA: hypothetical protein VGR28_08830 [Candidatus Thermoplasmatota archaeon]|jgi:hypothetical protein|nr:hypothetical protein [Candidatus Thermoplasmatota archaeon]